MNKAIKRVAFGIVLLSALALQAFAADWDKLGERKVSDRAETDTLVVTAARGMFDAIKIGVKEHAVRFYKVVVNFRRGKSEELDLRDVIAAGNESRVIDLRGGKRAIHSIVFHYEAKSVGRDGATVTVWGRR